MEMQASSVASILGSIFICCFNLGFHLSTTLCSLFFPVYHFFSVLLFTDIFAAFYCVDCSCFNCYLWILCHFSSLLTLGLFFLLYVTGICFSDYPLNFQDAIFNSLTFHSKSSIQVLSTNP